MPIRSPPGDGNGPEHSSPFLLRRTVHCRIPISLRRSLSTQPASGGAPRVSASRETITPLSEKLGLEIDTRYAKKDHASVVKSALECDGTVLICWDHKNIPALAKEILGSNTTIPQKWPKHRFDVTWVFDWDPSSEAYTFKQIPQRLLSGDSDTVTT